MNSGPNIVVAWCQVSGTSLYNLCGLRIARDKTPRGYTNTAACVVVAGSSQTSEIAAPVQTDTYTFKCYGGSDDPADAETVYMALFDRLHDQTGTVSGQGGIVTSELVAATLSIDPDEGWPVHIARFQIRTS